MSENPALSIRLRFGSAIGAIAVLSACGGGGSRSGGPISTPPAQPTPTPSPSPTPTPTPTPTPSPTPTPPATTNFNTSEFRRSDGPDFHNAVTAWEQGITGAGAIIAIIDTGIDADSPEFAGRIHPLSGDVAGSRGLDFEDDHGTNVSLVAGAARDNTGVLGIAFDATILGLRADTPGSCGEEDPDDPSLGCSFSDRNIAAGVDRAIEAGAAVINLSLGGGRPTSVLRNALARAAAAGIVIIVSAGNDGDSTDAGIDPDNPDPFALGTVESGGASVIIVGSVDSGGELSDFSNRAGNQGASFLTARGERICCVYVNGQLRITTNESGDRFVTLFSGTSFSTAQVAGAAALLAQAFPNLTGQEIVEILLTTARDAGAAGIDNLYGRGILDIANALSPQGTTSLAGSTSVVTIGADTGSASGPMGDAFVDVPLEAILLDKYDRAYTYDLGRGLRSATQRQPLAGAVTARGRNVSGSSERMALAFTIDEQGRSGFADSSQLRLSAEDAEQARVLAARVTMKLSPKTQIGFAFRESAGGMIAGLQGQDRPAFLIARGGAGDDGFANRADVSLALRRSFGPWGLTVSAEQGAAFAAGFRDAVQPGRDTRSFDVSSFGLAADRRFGKLETSLGLTWMQEADTVLGAQFARVLGAGEADSLFIDVNTGWQLAQGWRLGGSWREGLTRAQRSGLISTGSDFRSRAWALDLTRAGIFKAGDSLGLRVSQPLRVTGGGLNLNLPIAYDYASESATYGIRSLSLAPGGREMMSEVAWRGPLWNGSAAASVFYRRQPGHFADAPSDQGVAIKWSREF